jgi:4-hydroxy-tetrahydrodipicolinate synthase
MVNNCIAGDFAEGVKLNNQFLDCYNLLFTENNPAGAKAFLAEMGMVQNVLRLPGVPVSEGVQEKIKNYVVVNNNL